jgi:hypothetical protein
VQKSSESVERRRLWQSGLGRASGQPPEAAAWRRLGRGRLRRDRRGCVRSWCVRRPRPSGDGIDRGGPRPSGRGGRRTGRRQPGLDRAGTGEREHGRGLSGADTNSETLRSRPARDAAVAPDGGPVPSVRFVDCLGPAPRPPHPRPEPGRRRTAPAAATGHPSAPPRVTRGRDLSAPVDRWRAHRPASSLLSAVPPAGNGPPAGTTRRGGHRPGHGMSRTRPRTHPPSSPGSAASPRSARPSSSPVPQPAVSVPSGSTRPRHDRKGRTGCHARRIRR